MKHTVSAFLRLGGWAFLIAGIFYFFGGLRNWTNFEAGVIRALNRVTLASRVWPEPMVMLDVPFHRQEHSLSCEIASLRSALLYRGVDIEESDLIALMPFDPTPKKSGIWGDPNKGFVGDIDGKMFKTGYGIYWGPITQVANTFRSAEYFTGWGTVRLAEELEKGNPVIVWNYLGKGELGVWKTPEDKFIVGVNGEHSRVAMGYTGPTEDPTGFYLMDPTYGKIYEPIDEFRKKWALFGYSGVIVR